MRGARAFVAVSWVPLALGVILWRATGNTEGWNAWAVAATLGPVVIGVTAVLGTSGVLLSVAALWKGRPAAVLMIATLLAWAPLLWLMARRMSA